MAIEIFGGKSIFDFIEKFRIKFTFNCSIKDMRKYKMKYVRCDIIYEVKKERKRKLKLIKCIVNYLNLITFYHK